MAKQQEKPDTQGSNPLKNQNQSKTTTTQAADDASPTVVRRKAVDTVTGKGGDSDDQPDGVSDADTDHPSQHGGVTATTPHSAEDHPDRSGMKRTGPSPADQTASERTGTAPDRSGGPTRSGSTDGVRRREGRDV